MQAEVDNIQMGGNGSKGNVAASKAMFPHKKAQHATLSSSHDIFDKMKTKIQDTLNHIKNQNEVNEQQQRPRQQCAVPAPFTLARRDQHNTRKNHNRQEA